MSATVILNGKISTEPGFKRINEDLFVIFEVNSLEKREFKRSSKEENISMAHKVRLNSLHIEESEFNDLELDQFVSIIGSLGYDEDDKAYIDVLSIECDKLIKKSIP